MTSPTFDEVKTAAQRGPVNILCIGGQHEKCRDHSGECCCPCHGAYWVVQTSGVGDASQREAGPFHTLAEAEAAMMRLGESERYRAVRAPVVGNVTAIPAFDIPLAVDLSADRAPAESAAGMRVEILHDRHGDLHVHAAGCRDMDNPRRYNQQERHPHKWEVTASTELDVADAVYGEAAGSFYHEAGGDERYGTIEAYLRSSLTSFQFAPCTRPLRKPSLTDTPGTVGLNATASEKPTMATAPAPTAPAPAADNVIELDEHRRIKGLKSLPPPRWPAEAIALGTVRTDHNGVEWVRVKAGAGVLGSSWRPTSKGLAAAQQLAEQKGAPADRPARATVTATRTRPPATKSTMGASAAPAAPSTPLAAPATPTPSAPAPAAAAAPKPAPAKKSAPVKKTAATKKSSAKKSPAAKPATKKSSAPGGTVCTRCGYTFKEPRTPAVCRTKAACDKRRKASRA